MGYGRLIADEEADGIHTTTTVEYWCPWCGQTSVTPGYYKILEHKGLKCNNDCRGPPPSIARKSVHVPVQSTYVGVEYDPQECPHGDSCRNRYCRLNHPQGQNRYGVRPCRYDDACRL